MKHNAYKLQTHPQQVHTNMYNGTLACSLQRCAHGATQTCQSPLRDFQATSISSDLKDLWIWKSADNTSPHITVKPITLDGWAERRGGGCLPLSWARISTAAGGQGCQPIIRCGCHWLSGSRPRILSASQRPFSPKCPPDTEENKISGCLLKWCELADLSEKHKFYGLNKSNPICLGWHFARRLWKGQRSEAAIRTKDGALQGEFSGIEHLNFSEHTHT